MDKKKYLLIILLFLFIQAARAQTTSLQSADSTSNELYNRGDWKELILFGNETIAKGVDFPGLRLRIAYAFMMAGNYKKALQQYDIVLHTDAYNSTARFFAALCNKYLNNDLGYSYNQGFLTDKNGINSFGLIDAGVEGSVKENNDLNRDNSYYTRASLSNRLSWRWELEESFAYFNQGIFKLHDDDGTGHHHEAADNQLEYYAKLSYALNQHFALIGAYHYLTTELYKITYPSNVGLFGIKYNSTYADIQGDINFGRLDNNPITQYDGKVTLYPFGNFNLYSISKLSDLHLDASNRYVFNQTIGFKLIKNTWLESNVTFGDQDDYLDADGLYVYNAIDKTTFKCGETIFYQCGLHAQLQLNYAYERKDDTYQSLIYDQNSITLGVLWKF
jgi:hypothetical protein